MAKMEKIRKMQIADNKENKFFYFPMILCLVPGLGTKKRITLVSDNLQGFLVFTKEIMIINKECVIRFMFLALKKLITL